MALPTKYEALVRTHEKAAGALKQASAKKKMAKKMLKEQKKIVSKNDLIALELSLEKAAVKKKIAKIALKIAKTQLQNWEKDQEKIGKKAEKVKKTNAPKPEKAAKKLDIVTAEKANAEAETEKVSKTVPRVQKVKPVPQVEIVEVAAPKERKKRGPNVSKSQKAAPKDGDDLTLIEGIGAKTAATLIENGISTFALLATQDPMRLKTTLFAGRTNNLVRPNAAWIEQAELAAAGNFEALETLKATLKKGKA
ncbi:MAG: ribosomal protein [Bacteroidota bacterium]|jgi:large subunit ribosomal protein L17